MKFAAIICLALVFRVEGMSVNSEKLLAELEELLEEKQHDMEGRSLQLEIMNGPGVFKRGNGESLGESVELNELIERDPPKTESGEGESVVVNELMERGDVPKTESGEDIVDKDEERSLVNPLLSGVSKRGVATAHKEYTCYQNGNVKTQSVEKECVYAHTELRKLHGAKPLKWDADLAKSAQTHSDWMAKYVKLEHTSASGYGENIAMQGMSMGPICYGPSGMIKNWYDEAVKPGFDFKNPDTPNNMKAGHFSQVVWAETESVGCGLSTTSADGMEKTYLCCQYKPSGNMQGTFKDNVKDTTPKGKTKVVDIKAIDLDKGCDFYEKCPKYFKFCDKVSNACRATCPS